MSDEHEIKWSISDVKTTDGETMIVGGEGHAFGLIATVTDEADAKQIIADREARTGAPSAQEPDREVLWNLVKQHVIWMLYDDDRLADYPIFVTYDDRGLEEYEYLDFAQSVFSETLSVIASRDLSSTASNVELVASLMHVAECLRVSAALDDAGDHKLVLNRAAYSLAEICKSIPTPTTSPEPTECAACFGDGYSPKADLSGDDPCPACKGTGFHTSPEPDAVRALFEPVESNATDNLEGALIDIKRFKEAGQPTDDVCIRTIERVIKQLTKAEAALSRPAHGGWEDISTAPKDGSEMDLWSVSGHRWTRYRWDRDASYPAFTDGRFADRHWMDRPILPAELVTHWMPMPAGPISRHDRVTSQPDTDGASS